MVGESTTLNCTADCSFVDWYHNWDVIVQYGQLLDQGSYTERFNVSCNCETSMCELTILSAQIEDGGDYFCYDIHSWSSYYHSRVTLIRKLHVIFIGLHLINCI